ncbi:MAG: dipeptide ABC transporter ATP-binding protein [Gammaproteobacteria bacterium]|uniref:ABC transporter ATP-binding protein n=1 Tax=Rhodoferax sp. TaxID=50421 RepID=UPI00179A63CC|nr:dipeptide ABC transporter ATP-binding protein [Rhodoferax sp.]MBU3898663.1 dipeptide ABC transporter ATP-binding protein [Gammaproteobacteria bacterium]MBA3057020.1 ABC transporter ATP-binding protein [Rhodoferax sp.]MBU3998454.1 dipeptide ABC transporter ATP-binding protein [Gammaproteobacteria bacterium]MBU4019572.1 dipeptide ABC transporter ATP-binding protein [Gammaproteobacteria bacterium]MBU4079086.1 dipeptide ABC transporter ATP-binding protein [Gammaproteobacteria bacterium]
MLEIKNLTTELNSDSGLVRAVDALTLTIKQGETFALVGESGCGKSMTALSILRLLPDSGRVVGGSVDVEGSDILQLPEARMRDFRGRKISIIFQEPSTSLNPVMTVGRQITEVIERHTAIRGSAAHAKAIDWLQRVGIPEPGRRVNDYPFQMSGGQKQRVMIAIALAAEPDVVIADEPTTALDVTIQAQILDLLKELQRSQKMAMLLITHDLAIVAQMAHRVALMYAGQIVEVAEAAEFFARPLHPYAVNLFDALPDESKRGRRLASIAGSVPPLNQEFTACRFADRCFDVMDRCRSAPPVLTEFHPDHTVRCFLYDGPVLLRSPTHNAGQEPLLPLDERVGPTVLEVHDYKVWFPIRKGLLQRTVGYVKAVDGVSFSIACGRTLALVGESGSGKTTVGKALLQLLRGKAEISGSALLSGQPLDQLSGEALRTARRAVQIVFQDPFASLNPRMRVSEILEEGVSSLRPDVTPADRRERVGGLLEKVGLSRSALSRYPHEFSGGQRQRLAIARALAVEPQLIVADEPTSALDVSVQAQILNLLKQLQQELGVSYLFITHNFGVVEYLAHEIAVMKNGQIVESGAADNILHHPQHAYTQALLKAVPRLIRSAVDFA